MLKEELEKQKLELEIKKLKRKFLFRVETYVLFVPIICIAVTYFLNHDYIRQSLELDLKKVELKKSELNADVKELESQKGQIQGRIESLEKQLKKARIDAEDWKSRAKFYNTKYRESKTIKTEDQFLDGQYNEALVLYNKGVYKISEAKCWDLLANSKISHSLTGKAFLLLAKNFLRQHNYIDAREVLYSLKDNYNENDGIAAEGKDLLKEVESTFRIVQLDTL